MGYFSKRGYYVTLAVLFIIQWLMVGISRDDEFAEHSLFVKYRPTFQVYFYSPLGMDDRPLGYPARLDQIEARYDNFVRERHWSSGDIPLILAEAVMVAFGFLLLGGILAYLRSAFCTKHLNQISFKFILLLSAPTALTGCASLKQDNKNNIQQILSLSAFNGTYVNPSITNDREFSSLWNQLNLTDKIDTLDFQKATIALEAQGNNKIKATWLQNGIEKKSLLLKGKLKDNYFVSRNKRTVIPIPLIYGKVQNNQFQLSLGMDGQLYVDRLQNRWGWVFLFLAGKDETVTYQYNTEKE
ncbi:hypothetical protein [Sphingobacterium siyangense]|uniref:hypothetical protein n=1 Tax=Sphingobacterium siyangense TaxID=459529 RepID=UPI002FDB1391